MQQRVDAVLEAQPAAIRAQLQELEEEKRKLLGTKKDADQAAIYVEWCAQRLQGLADEALLEAGPAQDRLRVNGLKLCQLAAEVHDQEVVRKAFLNLRAGHLAAHKHSFGACADRPEIARIEVKSYGWMMVTEPLTMVRGKSRRRLGKMEIHLSRSGEVRLLNQTERQLVGGLAYDHPLVAEGRPLLPATVRRDLVVAAVRQEIDQAAGLLLPFLMEVGDSSLVPANLWPEEVNRVRRLEPEF